MRAALVLLSLSLIGNAQDDWRRALDRANALQLTDASGARREFQTAEHLAKQVGGESLVLVWIDFSAFLIQQDDSRNAEAMLRNALVIHDQFTQSRPVMRATILHGLALTRLVLGRPEESIELLRKAIAMLDGTTGVDQGATLPIINLLSGLYAEAGRISDARLTIQSAVTIARRIEKNAHAANTWIVLSEIERTAGNYDGARRAARNALKVVESPAPDKSPFFERVHNQMGRIAFESSNYKMAATHWKLALDSLGARRPAADEEVLNLRVDVARIPAVQGRLQEAEKELIAIIKLAEDHGRPMALARGLYVLGAVYSQQKRLDNAITVLVRSLTITDKVFGEMSPDSALCVGGLARIYLKARQPAEAAKLSGRVARISAGDHAVAVAWLDVMQVHAQVLQKLNRKAEAKEVRQRFSRIVASRPAGNQTIDIMDLMRQ